jgi:DNA-binding NarL/FixJ family response regulator
MIHIAIVEDDAELRSFMEEIIRESDEMMLDGSYGTAEDFKKDFARLGDLQVVIMDINLPGISGIQCISELKHKSKKIQFLICTIFEDNINLFNALCAGATGYLLKSASEEEIIRAIKDIHVGGSPMSPQIARMVVNTFPRVKENSKLIDELSKREKIILELLAAGFRYKEIADKLFLGVETIRSHIRNIYSKLHVHSRTDAVNKLFNK